VGRKSTSWVPAETASDEIKEGLIVTLKSLPKFLGAWTTPTPLGGHSQTWFAKRIKKQLLAGALLDQVLLGRTKDFHDTGKLLLLILSREDGIAREQLSQDTTQTPHINRHTVGHSKNNLWGTVETTLNVGIDLFILEAT
jgi:hypothetical protein